MHYEDNPTKTYKQTVLPYAHDTDPIVESLHKGDHLLFWDPEVHKSRIAYDRTIKQQCHWLNNNDIWEDPFRITSIVKLNIYINDIKRQGVVKPMLLYHDGKERFGLHTGENRMRSTECLPELIRFQSFITTHKQHADQFKNLESIKNFEQFVGKCKTPVGTKYLFKFTDSDAPYGIFWYEYDSDKTRAVTPSYKWCEKVMRNYLKANNITFTPEWFDTVVDWKLYE